MQIKNFVNGKPDVKVKATTKQEEQIKQLIGRDVNVIEVYASTETFKATVLVDGEIAPQGIGEKILNVIAQSFS